MVETPAPPSRPWWATVRDYVVGAVVVLAVLVAISYGVHSCQADAIAPADEFFADLRNGRIEEAYDSLAPARQRDLSLEAFREEVAHPVLQGHTASAFGQTPQWGPVNGRWHACTSGSLTFEGRDWYVEVYLTQRDEQPWRVHTWAIQEPRTMQVTMLDVCKSAW